MMRALSPAEPRAALGHRPVEVDQALGDGSTIDRLQHALARRPDDVRGVGAEAAGVALVDQPPVADDHEAVGTRAVAAGLVLAGREGQGLERGDRGGIGGWSVDQADDGQASAAAGGHSAAAIPPDPPTSIIRARQRAAVTAMAGNSVANLTKTCRRSPIHRPGGRRDGRRCAQALRERPSPARTVDPPRRRPPRRIRPAAAARERHSERRAKRERR